MVLGVLLAIKLIDLVSLKRFTTLKWAFINFLQEFLLQLNDLVAVLMYNHVNTTILHRISVLQLSFSRINYFEVRCALELVGYIKGIVKSRMN